MISLPSRHSPSGTNVTQTRDKAPDSSVRPPVAGFFALPVVLLLLPAKEDLKYKILHFLRKKGRFVFLLFALVFRAIRLGTKNQAARTGRLGNNGRLI